MPPYFSIITPMFNRQGCIARAIDSCLCQDFGDFEMIVVDDGSTDGSVAVVGAYDDPRVRLIRHGENRGVSPARNTGIDRASGRWIMLLDSDDELLPGAISAIHAIVRGLDDTIGRAVFMYRHDTGGESPDPPLRAETWGYGEYLGWSSTYRASSDYFNVIRRETFARVRFPGDRGLEALYHLEFARHFLTKTAAVIVAVIHSDAGNRSLNATADGLLKDASCLSRQHDEILTRHGEAIRKVSFRYYQRFLQGAITYNLLAGNRMCAYRHGARLLLGNALSFKTLAVLLIGTIGPKPLALMKIRMARRQKA